MFECASVTIDWSIVMATSGYLCGNGSYSVKRKLY